VVPFLDPHREIHAMSDLGFQLTSHHTRPVEVLITEPITAGNRAAIVDWIYAMGGKAELCPDGYEVAFVMTTDNGDRDASYGDVVVFGTRSEMYPIHADVYADKYVEVVAGPEPEEADELRPFCTVPVNDRQVCGQYLPCVDHG
jgi:hypothetical protein